MKRLIRFAAALTLSTSVVRNAAQGSARRSAASGAPMAASAPHGSAKMRPMRSTDRPPSKKLARRGARTASCKTCLASRGDRHRAKPGQPRRSCAGAAKTSFTKKPATRRRKAFMQACLCRADSARGAAARSPGRRPATFAASHNRRHEPAADPAPSAPCCSTPTARCSTSTASASPPSAGSPAPASALAVLWRDKQIEYTRLSSMSGRPRSFRDCTRAGLRFAARRLGARRSTPRPRTS